MVFFAILTTVLAGCQAAETTNSSWDELGYEYEILEYEDPQFDVVIKDIEFALVLREIIVEYDIIEYHSFYDYYFVYGYPVKSHRPFHRPFSPFPASGTYTLNLIYDDKRPEGYVTVEMGRIRDSVSVIGEVPESNSAGFRYRIKDIDSRYMIERNSFYFYESKEEPKAGEISLSIDDEFGAIDSIKVVLSDVFDDFAFEDEITIDIDASMRKDGKIIINDTLFHDLISGVRYGATVYVSGNDGFDDFVDIEIDHAQTVIE